MSERLPKPSPHPVRPLHPISSPAAASFPRLLIAALSLLCLASVPAAEPASARPVSSGKFGKNAAEPAGAKPGADAGAVEIQTGLRTTADMATRLYTATVDLKNRTDNLRILPGGSATKKAPFLLAQVDDLDKQRIKLRVEIARIEIYKGRNAKTWGDDLENQLLQLQISERSSAQTLADTRRFLEAKHRWYLLGL